MAAFKTVSFTKVGSKIAKLAHDFAPMKRLYDATTTKANEKKCESTCEEYLKQFGVQFK